MSEGDTRGDGPTQGRGPAAEDPASPGSGGSGSGGRMGPWLRAGAGVFGLVIMVLVAALSVLAIQAPDPAPADAPADSFSASRAADDVDQMARVPHPTGTGENDEVRAYILDRLEELGLDPQVQHTLGANSRAPENTNAAYVDNVYAVIPGTDSTGRLFLAGHYDTAQFAPGAADDTSATATLLEVARALKTGPPLRNDVVLLFTDAEESGGIGSEGFVTNAPIAADGGVILNWEARGSRGPLVMFETTDGNARLAKLFGSEAAKPVGTSAAVEVYRRLKNNTDFTQFLNSGRFTGLNSAFLDGAAVYHTPQDNPDYLSRSSLQAMGDNALSLTKALGNADLAYYGEPASNDETYFPVFGALGHYPGWLVWPLIAAAVVALVGYGYIARWRGLASYPRLAVGWVAALVPFVVGTLAVQVMWQIMIAVHPGYNQTLDLWHPQIYRVATGVVAVAVVLIWLALTRRRIGLHALVFGGLTWMTILGIAFAALAPGASYLFVLPTIAASVAGIISCLARNPWVGAVCALASAIVAIFILAPSVSMFMFVLGMSMAPVSGFVVVVMCFGALAALDLLLPDVEEPKRWWAGALTPGVAVVAAVALVASGLATDDFTERYPEPSQLMYAMDADSGEALWLSENPPTDYTEQFLDGEGEVFDDYPYIRHEVQTGPAPVADLPAPTVEVLSDEQVGGQREVSIRVRPERKVRLMTVAAFTEGTVTEVNLDGRDLDAKALGADLSVVTFHAPPADGIVVTYRIDGDGPVRIRAVGGSDGLEAVPGFVEPDEDVNLAGNSVALRTGNEHDAGFTFRPDNVDIAGTHSSELLMVGTTTELP